MTATHLTGLADNSAQVLRVTASALDLRGLLVAGIVVGALGVLDDVTVSQVSIVAALRRANPGLGWRLLYGEAMSVGRDHVASTVNTLVLAYAGASLPLLLFFTQGDQPVERLLTGELIAVEIVRMLVGSIGLVASVPITTASRRWCMGAGRDARVDDDFPQAHRRRHVGPTDTRPRRPASSDGQPEPTTSQPLAEAERVGPHVGTQPYGICSVSPGHAARPRATLTGEPR